MKKISCSIALALTLLLSGCVPVDCLNPLYSDKNTIVDKNLVGEWVDDKPEDGSLRFDLAGDAYQMVVTEKKEPGYLKVNVYDAHLVSLGGEKYLDVAPRMFEGGSERPLFTMDPARKGAQFAPSLEKIAEGMYLEIVGPTPAKGNVQELRAKLRPVHWIFKVELTEKSLSLQYFDREWVQEAIGKKLIEARHTRARSDDSTQWVLSGSTAELQQFVIHHGEEPGAFTGGMALRRLEEPSSTQQSKDPAKP